MNGETTTMFIFDDTYVPFRLRIIVALLLLLNVNNFCNDALVNAKKCFATDYKYFNLFL